MQVITLYLTQWWPNCGLLVADVRSFLSCPKKPIVADISALSIKQLLLVTYYKGNENQVQVCQNTIIMFELWQHNKKHAMQTFPLIRYLEVQN